MNSAYHTLRFGYVLLFLGSAITKLLDMDGFAQVLADYQVFAPHYLSALAYLIVVLEITAAVWLISGYLVREAAWIVMLVHLFYGVWSTVAWFRDIPLANVGRFGAVLPVPLSWVTLVEDLLLVLGSIVLYRLSRRYGQKRLST